MIKETQIETDFIEKLKALKYNYRSDIRNRAALELNFRQKFDALNGVQLTDAEFARLRTEIITADVFAAAKTLRERNTFLRDDDTPLQYTLVHIKDWCKNEFEVINQLRMSTKGNYHRYDVILLVNGLPLVQIELKTLEVSPRRAIQQIVQYKKDAGNGYTNSLLCFMQLFIVSNLKNTFYFTNNLPQHFRFNADEQFLPVYKFADDKNRKIDHLHTFAELFLAKCTLAEMISRYMVLVATEQKLLMMRPYQIYAVQRIMACIHENRGNGYIWHTTGSGKTLTSFKAATLLKDNPDIEKCLFVVDRKDLDRQTREEFNKFQEGCVEENTNTASLVTRLLSDDFAHKVIVTTIQKLSLALDPNRKDGKNKRDYRTLLQPLRKKRMVFIFDECHRSQFGDNHKAITDFFENAQLFGFTGTPIFDENASYRKMDGEVGSLKTTKDVFQEQLHAYTITHAIDDKNVLPFHIHYFKPDAENALPVGNALAQKAIVEAILAKHEAATAFRRFNALFATSSINEAIAYYNGFKTIQAERQQRDEDFIPLNIACVFSPPAYGNKEVQQYQEDLPQEKADNAHEPEVKKKALMEIIADFNRQYGTNHRISEFDAYYQDIQKRIKDQQYSNRDLSRIHKMDITIVVDMLLTGFDAKYLNTLYVDKKLQYHTLIQAFSRTNRVLNATKPYGTILDFRRQQNEVDNAMLLFSGENIHRAREIWQVEPAAVVLLKYQQAVTAFEVFLRSKGLPCKPEAVSNLKGELARGEFVNHFKEVQRFRTQLEQYTDLSTDDKQVMERLLPYDAFRSFKSRYLDVAQDLKVKQDKGEALNPLTHQLEFEFVLFASELIDFDYIMGLVAKLTQQKTLKKRMTLDEIISLIQSDAHFIGSSEMLIAFLKTVDFSKGATKEALYEGFDGFKKQQAAHEIKDIAQKHGLQTVDLQAFVDRVLTRYIFDGELLSDLLAPLQLKWRTRVHKELALMNDLIPILKQRADGREISGLSAYEE